MYVDFYRRTMSRKRLFANKFGGFSSDGNEYIIRNPRTPRPWINVISNGDYGVVVSQSGSGYSWRTHAQLNRITRWEQDLVKDEWGKYLFIRDRESKDVWSAGWKPACEEFDRYECRHGIGYTIIESENHGIESELLVFVPNDEPLELWKLSLTNTTRRKRSLSVYSYFEWCLGAAPDWHREFHKSFAETRYSVGDQAILATKRLWEVPTENGHWNTVWPYTAFHSSNLKPHSFDTDKESVLGMYGNQRLPKAIVEGKLGKNLGKWVDPVACLRVEVSLSPGETKTVVFTLGAADTEEQAHSLIQKYRDVASVDQSLQNVHDRWKAILGTTTIHTPDPAMDAMMNTWLKYQAISGRMWARTAYYQTGGAYGFRDQLQDSHVFLPIDSRRTKDQILLHARHQFKDGTVYHWWHPISEIGHVTPISDNLLWLPFVVKSYLDETADFGILDAEERFIDDVSARPLYDHCMLAIDKALERRSRRGLPLIGAGDWNDGLSAVGLGMKGESIWLGHFLHKILNDFQVIARLRGDDERSKRYADESSRLKQALNEHGWDGQWYSRATKDSGEKIGSSVNKEGRIFLNAQTWSVISGVANEDRANTVMDIVEKRLEFKAGPVLLTPAYCTPDEKIGYLTRYAPGARENGGVYTHAAAWTVIAEAMLKRGEAAYRIFSKLNPINRGLKPEEYWAEPYVTAGNSDGPDSPYYGRGGWTWYTGSAAWLFKVGLEWILGIRPSVEGLIVDPCIPKKWNGYEVKRKFRGSVYHIKVANPSHVGSGVKEVLVDGKPHSTGPKHPCVVLPVFPAGSQHTIQVTLG
jgi:cellobiose phosphorylase